MTRTFAICTCVVALAASCGRDIEKRAVEKAVERASGGEVEDLSIAGDKEASIPDGFPADVHILEPSRIEAAFKTPQGYSVSLLIEQDADKVAALYRKKMAEHGWTEGSSMDLGEVVTIAFAKGERKAAISVVWDDDRTRVSVTVMGE
ncbi:MAG: hypothetical protein GF331_15015 [Chitinivibrionales bacterium]|nr:hypothetical protein [Chitinivibrionales bacterium]